MKRTQLIGQMSQTERATWLQETKAALGRKMAREQAYLAHRARRGRRTPTDEAYEADQELERDLLWLLEEMEQNNI